MLRLLDIPCKAMEAQEKAAPVHPLFFVLNLVTLQGATGVHVWIARLQSSSHSPTNCHPLSIPQEWRCSYQLGSGELSAFRRGQKQKRSLQRACKCTWGQLGRDLDLLVPRTCSRRGSTPLETGRGESTFHHPSTHPRFFIL